MSTELALINQEIAELRSLVVQEKTNRLNDSLFSKELAPHYMQLAGQGAGLVHGGVSRARQRGSLALCPDRRGSPAGCESKVGRSQRRRPAPYEKN